MKVHTGVETYSDLINSVDVTAANVHEFIQLPSCCMVMNRLSTAMLSIRASPKDARRLARKLARIAMRPGKRRARPDTSQGDLQDLIETVKAHVRTKIEDPFRVIKHQSGFQKTRLRSLV